MKLSALILSSLLVFGTLTLKCNGAPVFYAAAAIPSILLVNNLATNIALLGAAKLGAAAVKGAAYALKGNGQETNNYYQQPSSSYNQQSSSPKVFNACMTGFSLLFKCSSIAGVSYRQISFAMKTPSVSLTRNLVVASLLFLFCLSLFTEIN